MSVLRELVNLNVEKGAKKRECVPEKWRRNITKKKRQSGQCYVNYSGNEVDAKTFTFIERCCTKNKCHEKVNIDYQLNSFKNFYDDPLGKSGQDYFLSSLLTCRDKNTTVANRESKRSLVWAYNLKIEGKSVQVCRDFVLKLYQISQKRLRVVQGKVVSGVTFEEKRGKHVKKAFSRSVWDLAFEHLKNIPHKSSHYTKSNRLYFDDPTLTVIGLYKSFREYYFEKTCEQCSMKYKTYAKFYKSTNYTVRKPKTDVCDYCTQCERKLEVDPKDPCRNHYLLHKKKAERFSKLRSSIINKSKDEKQNIAVFEFDYSQNLPLPKLNITSQFYKRLLWMYVFNVHLHNDDSSNIYTFLEGESIKGASSVASFLYHCVKEILVKRPSVKEIVFISDACGGQNKNTTMTKFCLWLSNVYGITVTQIFPVRGHSFNQCDRNFAVIKKYLKRKPVIEHPKMYLEQIVQCRKNPQPFNLLNDPSIIFDWEKALTPLCHRTPVAIVDGTSAIPLKKCNMPKYGIQQYSMLIFNCKGEIQACKSFNRMVYETFKYMHTFSKDLSLEPGVKKAVSDAKIKDVTSLLPALHDENRDFYLDYFESFKH